MHLLRNFSLSLALIFCVACAAGPAPESSPRHLRQSLRHLNKGTRLYTKGCFGHALKQFQDAHERYTAADHLAGAAASLNSLANTYYRMNDAAGALIIYDEAIEMYRLLNDRTGLVRAMLNKAAALVASGRLEDAEALLNQTDKLDESRGLLAGQRFKTRAILSMQRNEIAAAEKLLKKALHATPEKAYAQLAGVRYAMGRLLLASQRPDQAMAHLEAALQADREIGAYYGIAQDLAALGACRAQMDRHDQAVIYYKRSMKSYALLADASKVEEVRSKLAQSAAAAGVDIQAALLWADQWQAGKREANICR